MESTETKLKPLVTKGTNLFLGAVFLTGFIAPFIHIPFNNLGVEGVFGFKTMEGFLFSVGFPIFAIVMAILLYYASGFMPQGLVKSFKVFAFLTGFIGFYFLIWSLNPFSDKDFHPAFYYGSMIIVSVSLSYGVRFSRWITNGQLKAKIRYIMGLMVEDAVEKGHVRNQDLYEEEIIYPALDKLDER